MIRFSHVISGVLLALLLPASGYGQTAGLSTRSVTDWIPTPGILSNSISNLHAEGDTLWAGPYLSLTADGGAGWRAAAADSLFGTRNRVFSIDVEGRIVWVGLGYTSAKGEGGEPATAGFLYSEDGGVTFQYRFPHLDAPGDSTVRYGVSTLKALPVVVPEQSPPYDIDYDPLTGTVWVAAWASGLRRSLDAGRTWRRVVLPPDDLTEIIPTEPYTFQLNPRGNEPAGNYNHTAFSVLVDEEGVIWAGTPRGVNRSTDDGSSWKRFSHDGSPNGLTGSWVTSIEEQPLPGRNPVWMATWSAGETGEPGADGITVTRDGGRTFEQVLRGERIIDFAFHGETVYAAGRTRGLFVSKDGGTTWTTLRHFRDKTRPDRLLRPEVDVMSVATVGATLWVGSDDGLLKSTDGGQTWQVFRTDVPLHPQTPGDRIPDVETYAYPNPFSPAADQIVRIRFEAAQGDRPEIRIYDFGMNLVRRIEVEVYGPGEIEAVWDGRDDRGLRTANGAYLYAVRAGRRTVWGKILVLE